MANKKRPPLTKKRATWAEERGGAVFKGSRLPYPAAPQDRYQSALKRLVDQMAREYHRSMQTVFNELGYEADDSIGMDASLASQARIRLNRLQQRFAKLFRERAKPLVEGVFGQVDKASASSLHASLKELSGGLSLKTKTMSAPLAEAMTAAVAENVSLIKSIPAQYHTQIEGAVMRSMQPGGGGWADVAAELERYEGVTKRRAHNIALDQVRKATTSFNVERAKGAGIRKGIWIHSGGGVDKRKKHVDFDGKEFDLDNPPAIGDRGQRVLPGQDVNCRCTWQPVLDFGEE
jgi:uncharacterized protein with gpF-like domain